jgi:diacylglycerol kinase (ATP)
MFLSNCITERDQPKSFVRNARRNVKPYVIVNRRAGSVTDLDGLLSQLQRLEPAALRVTQRRGDAEKFAREAVREKCGYVVAAGGDGTLNEVINGIAKHARQVRLGLVPLGTGNDFARSLQLPLKVEENIDILLSQKSMAIDLVRIRSDHTRYFVNVAAGGFSCHVAERLTAKVKRAWGPLAYLRSAAAALPQLHVYETVVLFDDEERLAVDLYNVVIGNGRFVAGGLPIAPKADPADGVLDVILIPKRSGPEMALLAAEIVLGKHVSNDAVIFRRAKKIAVRSRPGMWFNVDGESVGKAPAAFQIIPGALNFVMSK